MLEGGERPAAVDEQLDAVALARPVLAAAGPRSVPVEPRRMPAAALRVVGVGDLRTRSTAPSPHDARRAGLSDHGPAQRSAAAVSASSRRTVPRSRGDRHAEPPRRARASRALSRVAARAPSGRAARARRRRRTVRARPTAAADLVGDRDDEVDPPSAAAVRRMVVDDRRRAASAGSGIDEPLGRVARPEARAARVVVGGDDVPAAPAQRADERDRAARAPRR